jgi:hypothetical protein
VFVVRQKNWYEETLPSPFSSNWTVLILKTSASQVTAQRLSFLPGPWAFNPYDVA